MSLHKDVLTRITPTPDEATNMAVAVARLEAALADALAAADLPGTPSVQGSIAKDTWLAGDTDVDCFLLMDPDLPEVRLKQVAEIVGPTVLRDVRRKYAQHPYLIGSFQDLEVDLVPAYRITDPSAPMTAVDRTPFHTAWVRQALDEPARQQVRLLKQWCKGVGVYGAETATGGFSGYLLEILVAQFTDFDGVLGWFAGGCQPRRLAPGGADSVEDDVSVLVVVDPVDPGRNCAAAVQQDILERAQAAAQAYLADPVPAFFFPAPPRAEEPAVLHARLADASATWVGLVTQAQTDRLDIVLPQFQRAGRVLTEALERAGFPVQRHDVTHLGDDGTVAYQWVCQDVELPAERVHQGPPASSGANADRFRAKWQDHPDAVGAVEEAGGRVQVRLRIHARRPHEWLRANLPDAAPGKHVQAAFRSGMRVLHDPATVPPEWAPHVADHVLDRRPWQRPPTDAASARTPDPA